MITISHRKNAEPAFFSKANSPESLEYGWLQVVIAYDFCIQVDITDLVRRVMLTAGAGYGIVLSGICTSAVVARTKLSTTLCHFLHGL